MPVIKDPEKIRRNCRRIYGCELEHALELNGNVPLRTVGSPAQRYTNHKTHADSRGVEWRITFPEWLAIWMASGKWHLRGSGKDRYAMARRGDAGAYEAGNVYICSNSQNAKDGHMNGVMHAAPKKDPRFIRGYLLDSTSKSRPYRVRVGGKQVGQFATPEEARAAYWRAVGAG